MRHTLLRRLGDARAEAEVMLAALRHSRTPWYAKAWLLLVVGYAVSPIDLIPDFIPVLGLLDDALLLPLGFVVARRLVPDDVLAECRAAAGTNGRRGAMRVTGVALVLGAWVVLAAATALLIGRAR